MKTHLLLGALIGTAVNLVFQYTDRTATLNVLELVACASVAALAAFTTALLQRPTKLRSMHHPASSIRNRLTL